jgi:hypothetical protein
MQNKLTKYRAAVDAADRWLSEIAQEIKPVAKRYIAIQKMRSSYYTDCMPSSIEHISDQQGNVIFSGYSYYSRGCQDSESISLPREIVYATNEEREAIFTKMESDIAAERKKAAEEQAARTEAAEKEHFLALRAKYEGTPNVR